MSNSTFQLNQRICNLYGLVGQSGGTPVPTSSNLSDVLANGNSAGGQSITNANTITANQFIGDVSGNTTNATRISTTGVTNNQTYYLPFVSTATTSSSQSVYTDSNGHITFNPSTNQFSTTGVITNNGMTMNGSASQFLINNNSAVTPAISAPNALLINFPSAKVTATTFVGDLSGNALNATNVGITTDNTSGTYYLPFAKTSGTGNKPLFIDDTTTPLTYNPSTSTLTATTFSGTATNATNIAITNTNTGTTYYPTFVSTTSSNNVLRVDSQYLIYNALNNILQNPQFSVANDVAEQTSGEALNLYSSGTNVKYIELLTSTAGTQKTLSVRCANSTNGSGAFSTYVSGSSTAFTYPQILSTTYNSLSQNAKTYLYDSNANLITTIPNGEGGVAVGFQSSIGTALGSADMFYNEDQYSTTNIKTFRLTANGLVYGLADASTTAEGQQIPTTLTSTYLSVNTSGVLTTTSPPVCATAPTTANQLGNKTYIDNYGGSGGWYYTTTISPSATTTLNFPNCLNTTYNAYDIYFVSNLSSPTSGYVTFQMSFTGITTPTYQSWTSSLSSTSGAAPTYLNSYATTAPYINFGQDFSSFINRAYTYPLELWGTKSVSGGASSGRFQYKTEGQTSSNPGFTGYANQFGSVGYASGSPTGITLTASSAVTGSFTIIVKAKY